MSIYTVHINARTAMRSLIQAVDFTVIIILKLKKFISKRITKSHFKLAFIKV